jgi:hypothetical protein
VDLTETVDLTATLSTPLQTIAPRYGHQSLADVMPSVLAALGVPGSPDRLDLTDRLDGVKRIAVVLVDGFGYHQLPPAAPHGDTIGDLWFGRLGRIQPLTTGFPSTTPASLVSLGTGVAPGPHGVLGFRVNVPGTDRVLNHVEWSDDPDPLTWQPVRTQLEVAEAAGITVTAVSRPEFEGSGLTVAANRGGAYRAATDTDGLAATIREALAAGPGPNLVYGYHPDLDKAGHVYGVDSIPWRAAVQDVDRLLTLLMAELPPDTAIVVTADHGQLNIPADRKIDMDADPQWRQGTRLVAGESRVRYLHTLPGATEDVIATWHANLGDKAWVAGREEAIEAGWFGLVPAEHAARIGDVVVACHADYVISSSRLDTSAELAFAAYHGSYTAIEMTIPLIVVRG